MEGTFYYQTIRRLLWRVIRLIRRPMRVVIQSVPLRRDRLEIIVAPRLFVARTTTRLRCQPAANGRRTFRVMFQTNRWPRVRPLQVPKTGRAYLGQSRVGVNCHHLTRAEHLRLRRSAVNGRAASLHRGHHTFWWIEGKYTQLPKYHFTRDWVSDF